MANSPKKTIHVAALIDTVNRMLALPDRDPYMNISARWALISLLEGELHTSNAYAGFGYNELTNGADISALTDETRRHYYYHYRLGDVSEFINKKY